LSFNEIENSTSPSAAKSRFQSRLSLQSTVRLPKNVCHSKLSIRWCSQWLGRWTHYGQIAHYCHSPPQNNDD